MQCKINLKYVQLTLYLIGSDVLPHCSWKTESHLLWLVYTLRTLCIKIQSYTIHFFINQNVIRSTVSKYWFCLVFVCCVLWMCVWLFDCLFIYLFVCLLVYMLAVLREYVRAIMRACVRACFKCIFTFNLLFFGCILM